MFNRQNHLYIHPENQELLWKVMQKSPLFQNMQNQYKHIWFKSIIQYFYEKYASTVITPEILQHLNRETIQYMVEALKSSQEPSIPVVRPIETPQNPYPPSYMGKTAESMQKHEVYTKAFEQRQRDFQTLLSKPTAPEVDFKEKMEDGPIRNMEELIEQHRREREQLNHFVSNQMTDVQPTTTKSEPNKRIQISTETAKELLPVIQIEMKDTSSSSSKRVSWEEDISKEKDKKIIELEMKNEWLMKKYDELRMEIDFLKKYFEDWKIQKITKAVVNEIIDHIV
jgi:hypothetical protein